MPVIRRLLPPILVAAVTLGLTTASAVAAGVEVTDESTGLHCTEETCDAHVASDGPIIFEAFGSPLFICDQELNLEINEDGTGEFVNQSLTGSQCSVDPCVGHWPINITEDGAGSMPFEMLFCIQNSFWGIIDCHLVDGTVETDGHATALLATAAECENIGPDVHVTGSWTVEEDMLELAHAS